MRFERNPNNIRAVDRQQDSDEWDHRETGGILRQVPRAMRESSQEVPAAVDDREDRDTSLVKSVSDPVVAYDQFADGLVTVLRDYPAQPGMMSKTIDVADKAPGHSSRVCHRVLTDVRDDFSEIGSGTYRPADRSHLARLRLTSSWD